MTPHEPTLKSTPGSAGLSVALILPVLNERERLPQALAALFALVPSPTVVVVDGGSHDGTPEAVAAFPQALLVRSPRGRGRQLNAGIGAAPPESNILLFLHADCALSQDSYETMLTALQDETVQGGAFRFAVSDSDSPWARVYERGVAARCWLLKLPYGDQGFFVRRNALARVGAFQEWPLFEDVEWFTRLRRAERVRMLASPLPSSARRFVRRGWLQSALRNQALLALYGCGVSPRVLAKLYALTSSHSVSAPLHELPAPAVQPKQ